MTEKALQSARGFSIAVAFGLLAGVLVGMACMLLEVGGRGPESGLWVILMPFVGVAVGLVAGGASWAFARTRPDALRVALVALATVAVSFGLGHLVLDGFDLGGVETGFAAAAGAVCGWMWPRWCSPRPPRTWRAVPRAPTEPAAGDAGHET